jgi:hypothetical protein
MNNPLLGPLWRRNAPLFLALLLATGMWMYVRRVLVPYQRADAVAHDHPRGNLSDLYPRWLGARELLLHGRDPYSSEVTREIETGYYGREIDPSRPGDPQDQQAFAYPVYVVFLLAPVVYIPFEIIRIPFYGVLISLICASVVGWLGALRWSASTSTICILICLTLGSMPVVQGIELQQLTLVVTSMLVICALLLANGKFALAGVLLGLTTIKPQLVLPLMAWLTLWSVSDWRRRKNFLLGFILTLAILFAAAEWVLPGWMNEFAHAVGAYRQYSHAASLFDNLINRKVGLQLSIAVALMAAAICWRLRHDSEQSPRFVFVFALILAVTVAIVPSISTYNQLLLLPGILFLVGDGPSLSGKNYLTRPVWILAATCLFWPWVAALGLAIASFLLPAPSVQKAWMLPFYTSLAAPLAVLGLLFQYAFHALHSPRLPPASGQSCPQ